MQDHFEFSRKELIVRMEDWVLTKIKSPPNCDCKMVGLLISEATGLSLLRNMVNHCRYLRFDHL